MPATDNNINNDVMDKLMSNDTPKQSSAPYRNPMVACVEKCTHPPKAVPGFRGLPTNDARSQVIAQYKNTKINSTPYIYDYTAGVAAVRPVTAADLATFDYAYLIPNGGRVLAIPFVYNTSTQNLQQDYNNVDVQDNYDFNRLQDDATLIRPCYKSTTTNLNATQFNDTGLVAGCQFNPNILFAGTLLAMAHDQPRLFALHAKYHHSRASLRVEPNHPEHHIHRAHHAEFPGYVMQDVIRQLGLPADTILKLDPNTSAQVVSFGEVAGGGTTAPSPVPSPSQILTLSTRSASWPAREGTFHAHRLNTITPAWLTASNTSASPNNGFYACYKYYQDESGAAHYVSFADNTAPGAAPGILYDTLWSKDMTWAWLYYQGLSLNSQTSTSFQLMIKKYYTGYEIQPSFTSAWAGMVELAPQPNMAAMQAILDVFYTQKDIMPAKYNFLGSLVKLAGPLIKQLGGAENILGAGTKFISGLINPPKAAKPTRVPAPAQVKTIARKEDNLAARVDALSRQLAILLADKGTRNPKLNTQGHTLAEAKARRVAVRRKRHAERKPV
jgi:hypothetical protein